MWRELNSSLCAELMKIELRWKLEQLEWPAAAAAAEAQGRAADLDPRPPPSDPAPPTPPPPLLQSRSLTALRCV
jgi:hypothetical protein